MKINDIFESTTAGSISTIAMPIGEVKKRETAKVDGLEPVAKAIKAKKKGPYMNSLIEGKMKELDDDLKNLKDADFKKKYKMSKADMKKNLTEEEVIESDIILVPGQGRSRKTGFVVNDPDRAEHEGQTLKNSLHTIIRVAQHLDKELSTRDNFPEWVSEKIGATKSMMVSVMDYLISAKEMQHDPDAMDEMTGGVIAGGIAAEGKKVDRFVKHVEKSEEKVGKSKKDAESIAWATANKRGMLDNKNKKK